jgi:putative transposase
MGIGTAAGAVGPSQPAMDVETASYDTVAEARASIGRYLSFYNTRRPHSSLDRQTPDRAYFTRLPQIAAA